MANKILKIESSTGTDNLDGEVVYRDISLESQFKKNTKIVTKLVMQTSDVTVQEGNQVLVQDDDILQVNHMVKGKFKVDDQMVLQNSINIRAVQNSLNNIFSWIPGERVINPEFGSKLHEYLYEGITDYNQEQIVAEIKNSIHVWEPRVVVKEVINQTKTSDIEDNTVVLDIKYYIQGLPDEVYDKQYIFNRSM